MMFPHCCFTGAGAGAAALGATMSFLGKQAQPTKATAKITNNPKTMHLLVSISLSSFCL
jgi:hypothetical protein